MRACLYTCERVCPWRKCSMADLDLVHLNGINPWFYVIYWEIDCMISWCANLNVHIKHMIFIYNNLTCSYTWGFQAEFSITGVCYSKDTYTKEFTTSSPELNIVYDTTCRNISIVRYIISIACEWLTSWIVMNVCLSEHGVVLYFWFTEWLTIGR